MTAALHIAIGADHAGYSLKQHLIAFLRTAGHTVDDLGTHSAESCDYPPICAAVGRAVRDGKAELGIVLGGSGQGEQLAANKVMGVRAAYATVSIRRVWRVSTTMPTYFLWEHVS